MDKKQVKMFAQRLLDGEIEADELIAALDAERTLSLDRGTLDLDRHRRCGFPEVVYAEGKSTDLLCEIVRQLTAADTPVLATRVSEEQATAILGQCPQAHHNALGRTLRVPSSQPTEIRGEVAVVTAGACDASVAEEAHETLAWMGVADKMIHDVGVAGPHRLLAHVDVLRAADAVIVVAGMEGALPSVVAGHVACPVIGVPTSVGYGAALGGCAALLSMLNSCAANVTVVNIDAGFKAGYVAGLIATRRASKSS